MSQRKKGWVCVVFFTVETDHGSDERYRTLKTKDTKAKAIGKGCGRDFSSLDLRGSAIMRLSSYF